MVSSDWCTNEVLEESHLHPLSLVVFPELYFWNLGLCSLSCCHSLLRKLIALAVPAILLDPRVRAKKLNCFPRSFVGFPLPPKSGGHSGYRVLAHLTNQENNGNKLSLFSFLNKTRFPQWTAVLSWMFMRGDCPRTRQRRETWWPRSVSGSLCWVSPGEVSSTTLCSQGLGSKSISNLPANEVSPTSVAPSPHNLLIHNINYNRNSYLKIGFHSCDCTT